MLFGHKTMLALRTKLFSRRMFRSRLRDAVSRNRLRPRFELLEERRVLATVTWDGGAGTTAWEDAANWSTDSLPTAADDVVIADLASPGTTFVTLGASYSIQSLDLFGTDVYTNQSSDFRIMPGGGLNVATTITVTQSFISVVSGSLAATTLTLGSRGYLSGRRSNDHCQCLKQ